MRAWLGMSVLLTFLKALGIVAIVAVWAYGLYLRGGYQKRKHDADVQTLFSGRK